MADGTAPTEVSVVTHPDRVHGRNEDALAVDGRILSGSADLFRLTLPKAETHELLVTDGPEGHARDDVASLAPLRVVAEGPSAMWTAADWTDRLHVANDRLNGIMARNPRVLGLGTTIVGAVVSPQWGDLLQRRGQPLYRFDPQGMMRMGVDDVPPWANTRQGRRSNHQITQSLGGRPSRTAIVPHVREAPPLTATDGLLPCSDELTDKLDDREIARVWSEADDASTCVAELLSKR